VLQTAPPDYDLAIWHGVNVALVMSIVALIGGILVYAGRRPLFNLAAKLEGPPRCQGRLRLAPGRILALAGTVTRTLDTGSLQRMLLVFILSALTLGMVGFLGGGAPLTGNRALLPADAVSVLVTLALVTVALWTVVLHRRRLTALIVMGALGLLMSLIFVKFSAPDLALTQLSVEVVTIVLLLLALYFLPQYSPSESSWPGGSAISRSPAWPAAARRP
jgi:multicomponent K+:H+ antiporter subunit A